MIAIKVRIPFAPAPRFATVRKRGVQYDLGGEQIELFTVRVLAAALDRSRDTVLVWEELAHLPPPLFRTPFSRRSERDGTWRMYSGVQVVNANMLAMKHFGGRRRVDDSALLARFAAELRGVWYSPELLT